VVTVQLTQGSRARKKVFDFDFAELDIKGRGAKGNTVTKYPVRKVSLKEAGKSTLGAIMVWIDEVSGRLNTDERGQFLGEFDTSDQLLAIYKDGTYEVAELDLSKKFTPSEIVHVGKFEPGLVISAVYYEGERGWSVAKRFQVETSSTGQRFSFITEHKKSKLLFASVAPSPSITYKVKEGNKKVEEELHIAAFIDVKGWRAVGNKVSDQRLMSIKELPGSTAAEDRQPATPKGKLKAGDSLDFDVEDNGQGKMF